MKRTFLALLPALAWAFAACGSDAGDSKPGDPADGGAEGATSEGGVVPAEDGGGDTSTTQPCVRNMKEADRARKVVASHPFISAGVKGKKFEVLDLDVAGVLTRTGTTFEMGTANDGSIVFTPDGEIGLVPQDDGSVGAFRFGTDGKPIVIHAGLKGGFYAQRVVMGESGARAFVLDPNTKANGGGVYELAIGCDGTITPKGLVIPGGTAHAMELLPGDPKRAVLFAGAAFASGAGTDTHLVDLAALTLVASGTGFSDHEAIVSSLAITQDGKYALVADDGPIEGSRLAVVRLPAMTFVQMIATEFPAAVVASIFGNAALVLNDDATDELTVLAYDAANATTPFSIKGRVPYTFKKPEIPISAVQVTRGALSGRVILSENLAVRQVQFTKDGAVVDTAQTSLGTTIPDIVGVVGVQP